MATSMSGSGGYAPPGRKWEGDNIPKGQRMGQVSNFTPEQSGLFKQGMENVGPNSYLSRLAGGDPAMFNEMEAPAFNQFNEQMGGMASRFSGMGMGGRKSSGFQNMGGQAASNFAQSLQSNRMNIRNQAIQSLHGMSQDLLNQRPYDRFMYEKPQKPGTNWGGIGGGVIGATGGFIVGGPAGAVQGAQAGYQLGSAGQNMYNGQGGNSGGGGGMNFGDMSSMFSGGGGGGEVAGTTSFSHSSGFGTPPWA